MNEPRTPSRDVTSVGEGQLRLGSRTGTSLEEADTLRVTVAGAEGNVLGLLSRLGNRTGMFTCLPANPLGRRVAAEYRAAGVDISTLRWHDAGRLALYFVEHASPPVPSRVFYDRADSCFSHLTEREVPWEYLADSRLVHLTGITAALTDQLASIVQRAAERAASAGQLVSVDVNYRSELSTAEAARDRMSALLPFADVISWSRRDAQILFGLSGRATEVARMLRDRFAALAVLVSDGPEPVAVVSDDGRGLTVQPQPTAIVDRVGAGDALVGGFLHGFLRSDIEMGLRLGVAAAALALTRHGDQVHTTVEELEYFASRFATDIVR